MKAVVVYESHWGNTAAIAKAIAEGIGPDARALTTDEASPEVITDADLIVAGAPVIAFRLPDDRALEGIAKSSEKAPTPPDVSHPSLHAWLSALPAAQGYSASFETGVRWSPGSAAGAIRRRLAGAGYRPLGKPRRFVVKGMYGPLRVGEVEQARRWGVELARSVSTGSTR
jgi:hypothetical protein